MSFSSKENDRVSIFGVSFTNDSMEEAVDRIVTVALTTDRACQVVTPNVDHLVQLRHNSLFRAAYEEAEMIYCDGVPVCLMAKALGYNIKEKVSGSDLVIELLKRINRNPEEIRIFFFGATEESLQTAIDRVRKDYPGLTVDGFSPPYGFEKSQRSIETAIEKISIFNPHVVIVGLGAPKQELFVFEHKSQLSSGVYLCAGASIDFLSGHQRRAPVLMQKAGLEWVFRMLSNPKRFVKRYLLDFAYLPVIFGKEILKSFGRRWQ